MNYEKLWNDISEELDSSDIVDVHTHIRWVDPQARDLAEIVFYHFVMYELCSAGMPEGVMKIEDEKKRLEQALPFIPLIRNTGTHYCLRRILKDLFGMKEDLLCEDNVDELMGRVKETSSDKAWPREVLVDRGKIKKSFLNILPCKDWAEKTAANDPDVTRYADIFVPAMEDQSFVMFDAKTLIEHIERHVGVTIKDAATMADATQKFIKPAELDALKTYLAWATVDFLYHEPDQSAADSIIKKVIGGERSTPEEDNVVRVFAFTNLLEVLRARKIPFQFFFGSECIEKGPAVCGYSDQTFRKLPALFVNYPDMQFDLFVGSVLFSQEAAIQVKLIPNLHIAGIWWHNMYPSYIRRILGERMDVCPMNKVTAFFSDAYMAEWSYGKRKLIQRELAGLLAERVSAGYITRNDASVIARRWMWENPVEMYGI
jgi:glucuronate isomerase